jgi:hypothetical protein
MEITYKALRLDKQSLIQLRIMYVSTRFIWISVFFDRAFEYGDDGIFRLLRWIQKLHQSTCDHKIFYGDRS